MIKLKLNRIVGYANNTSYLHTINNNRSRDRSKNNFKKKILCAR